MRYFNDSFINFFNELSANNNKAWFDEHRKVYEKEVKKPFASLVQEMINRINKHESEVQIKPSEAIMRINKDIRFSKEKIPYNTHVGANISKFGKKDKSYPGFYFQLSPRGIMIYGGIYMVDTKKLQSIRHYISDHLKAFSEAYSDPLFIKTYKKIAGEQNKRIPKEFQEIVKKEPLVANKQFYYSTELPQTVITSEQLPEKLMACYLAGRNMSDFLREGWNNG